MLDEPVLDEPVLDEPDVDEAVLDEPVLGEAVLGEAVLDALDGDESAFLAGLSPVVVDESFLRESLR